MPDSKYEFSEGSRYPKSEYSEDNIDKFHLVLKHFCGGNFKSPVKEILEQGGAKVLDLRCGSGTWAIDMAKTYPNSEFYAIDIKLSQWSKWSKDNLGNLKFEQNDLTGELPWEDNTFDFVHQRALFGGYRKWRWPFIIKEMVRVAKPGGWVECVEPSLPSNEGSTTAQLNEYLTNFLDGRQVNADIGPELHGLLEDSESITNIAQEQVDVVFGERGGQYGEMILNDAKESWLEVIPLIQPTTDKTPEEWKSLIDDTEREFNDFYTTSKVYRVCGQKKINDD